MHRVLSLSPVDVLRTCHARHRFDPESHVKVALAAVEELPKSPVEELLAQVQSALAGIGA